MQRGWNHRRRLHHRRYELPNAARGSRDVQQIRTGLDAVGDEQLAGCVDPAGLSVGADLDLAMVDGGDDRRQVRGQTGSRCEARKEHDLAAPPYVMGDLLLWPHHHYTRSALQQVVGDCCCFAVGTEDSDRGRW